MVCGQLSESSVYLVRVRVRVSVYLVRVRDRVSVYLVWVRVGVRVRVSGQGQGWRSAAALGVETLTTSTCS